MARPKKIKAQIHDLEAFVDLVKEEKHKVLPITETFGNGELNSLKDKINELIANQ